MLDTGKTRQNFPALSLTDDGRRRIYLDNPAGTQVPRSVADAIHGAILEDNANLGGNFVTSRRSGAVWEAAHSAMADFLGAGGPEEIVIGPNMTSLTYHLSRTIGRDWGPGDEVLCTRMDHEGNVGPWAQIAADRGATCRFVPFSTQSWQVEPDALRAAVTERTRLVALGYASNLSGSINDIRELTAIAREAGALVYVDAVQFAPHGLIDVAEIGCDFLACSAYKFFGPHLGVVWGDRQALDRLAPYKLRCSTNDLPGRLETGTPQIELLAGLAATVDYFAELGTGCGADGSRRDRVTASFAHIGEHETALARQLVDGIATIEGLKIHGISAPDRFAWRVPTVSFTIEGIGSKTLVKLLNEENIFCWAGHNYAWQMVHELGIDPGDGVVRIGMAHYNTPVEIGETVGHIAALTGMLRQRGAPS
jgi:cysteine desulfurase family protein (TIGR01976 family)